MMQNQWKMYFIVWDTLLSLHMIVIQINMQRYSKSSIKIYLNMMLLYSFMLDMDFKKMVKIIYHLLNVKSIMQINIF